MVPSSAPGLEFLGRYQGGGRSSSGYLLRRADGHMLEVSELLYTLMSCVDGSRTTRDIAAEVTSKVGRQIDAAGVAYLIENKLVPLGAIDTGDFKGGSAVAPPAPVLGLAFKTAVIPPNLVAGATRLLTPLFRMPAVVGILAGIVAFDAWLAFEHGIGQGIRQVLLHPSSLVVVVIGMVVGAGFHELGHATASRFGGARPGTIGAAIYLLWPAFYNDLNDSYRLDRAGRLRCDLGGMYFNCVFVMALAAAYALTGWELLIVLIVLQHGAVVQQLLPFIRLDGYYIVSDIAGVPDLFGRVGPVLSGLVPGRRRSPKAVELQPRAQRVVVAWVLLTVPAMAVALAFLAVRLPVLIDTALDSLSLHRRAFLVALEGGQVVPAAASAVQIALLAIPLAGVTAVIFRLFIRISGRAQRAIGAGVATESDRSVAPLSSAAANE